ncbi:nuclear transport factor 2 family protein [Bifidobacterium canis]|uniref:Conjugal transfer protein n=1 Tax=Bifidobacterium canis TaxID=2610880 RepID=A0A7K1J7H7_9BIFI|nr:nuclear transport factor 2 family protein [Bifidobacterium canis]MUH60511.1 conjugal transfer protein [Bifidobacterium canis]
MNERERIIRLWFDMWLQQRDLGIDEIFADHAEYMESYGPRYEGCEAIRRWFEEWNKHGKVLTWRIEQFFHKNNQTVVQWYFKNWMDDGRIDDFDGMSLVKWADDNKILFLQEFACSTDSSSSAG